MNTPNIWTDQNRCNGKPCIRNTRFSVAQLIAELAEGRTVEEIAEDFRLDCSDVEGALEEVAMFFDKPWKSDTHIRT